MNIGLTIVLLIAVLISAWFVILPFREGGKWGAPDSIKDMLISWMWAFFVIAFVSMIISLSGDSIDDYPKEYPPLRHERP